MAVSAARPNRTREGDPASQAAQPRTDSGWATGQLPRPTTHTRINLQRAVSFEPPATSPAPPCSALACAFAASCVDTKTVKGAVVVAIHVGQHEARNPGRASCTTVGYDIRTGTRAREGSGGALHRHTYDLACLDQGRVHHLQLFDLPTTTPAAGQFGGLLACRIAEGSSPLAPRGEQTQHGRHTGQQTDLLLGMGVALIVRLPGSTSIHFE